MYICIVYMYKVCIYSKFSLCYVHTDKDHCNTHLFIVFHNCTAHSSQLYIHYTMGHDLMCLRVFVAHTIHRVSRTSPMFINNVVIVVFVVFVVVVLLLLGYGSLPWRFVFVLDWYPSSYQHLYLDHPVLALPCPWIDSKL